MAAAPITWGSLMPASVSETRSWLCDGSYYRHLLMTECLWLYDSKTPALFHSTVLPPVNFYVKYLIIQHLSSLFNNTTLLLSTYICSLFNDKITSVLYWLFQALLTPWPQAERCSLFLVDRKQQELVAKVFDGVMLPDGSVEVTKGVTSLRQDTDLQASKIIFIHTEF